MPDTFYLDARGRIVRKDTNPNTPDVLVETLAVSYSLTQDEVEQILALPVTDPVRIAYTSRAQANSLPGVVPYADLPDPAKYLNWQATTTDFGLVYSDGSTWIALTPESVADLDARLDALSTALLAAFQQMPVNMNDPALVNALAALAPRRNAVLEAAEVITPPINAAGNEVPNAAWTRQVIDLKVQEAINGTAPVLNAPQNTVLPVVTISGGGSAIVGKQLLGTTGTWVGSATITYAYQWFRGSSAIPSATSINYTPTNDDVGPLIRLRVRASNGAASNIEAFSAGLIVTGLVVPAVTTAPSISLDTSTPSEGFYQVWESTVRASSHSIPITAPALATLFAVQLSDNDATAFTWPAGFTQIVSQANTLDGMTLGVAIKNSATGSEGSLALSATTDTIAAIIAITGRDNTTPLDVAAVVANTNSGAASPWTQAAAIDPANTGCQLLAIAASDVNADQQVVHSFEDTLGLTWTKRTDLYNNANGFFNLTAATALQASGHAALTLTVTGVAGGGVQAGRTVVLLALRKAAGSGTGTEVGNVLTAVDAVWSATPTARAHQWYRVINGSKSLIPGATDPTYTISPSDLGYPILVTETATIGGQAYPADSAAVNIPLVANDIDFQPYSGALPIGSTVDADEWENTSGAGIFAFGANGLWIVGETDGAISCSSLASGFKSDPAVGQAKQCWLLPSNPITAPPPPPPSSGLVQSDPRVVVMLDADVPVGSVDNDLITQLADSAPQNNFRLRNCTSPNPNGVVHTDGTPWLLRGTGPDGKPAWQFRLRQGQALFQGSTLRAELFSGYQGEQTIGGVQDGQDYWMGIEWWFENDMFDTGAANSISLFDLHGQPAFGGTPASGYHGLAFRLTSGRRLSFHTFSEQGSLAGRIYDVTNGPSSTVIGTNVAQPGGPHGTPDEWTLDSNTQAGIWYRFALRMKLASIASQGPQIQLWRKKGNDAAVQVLNWTSPNNGLQTNSYRFPKTGIYKFDGVFGTKGTRTFFRRGYVIAKNQAGSPTLDKDVILNWLQR